MSEQETSARTVAPGAQRVTATPDATGLSAEPTRPGHQAILRLQRLAGNQAILQLLGRDGPQSARAGAERAASPPMRAAEGFVRADTAAREAPVFPAPATAPGVGSLAVGSYKFGRHPQFPTAMGQTYYARNDIEIWPSFNLTVEQSMLPPWNYEAKPKTTDAAGSAWPVLATPASEEGYKMPDEHPKHPGYEYWIRVSPTAAEKIVGAEAQHVADLDAGWDLTGYAAKKAINAAAAEDPATGDSPQAAKAAAVSKAVAKMGGLGDLIKSSLESGGRLEDALGPMMDNAFRRSKEKRDDSKKHYIPLRYVMTDEEGKKVLYEAEDETPLDATATSEVVNLGTIGS